MALWVALVWGKWEINRKQRERWVRVCSMGVSTGFMTKDMVVWWQFSGGWCYVVVLVWGKGEIDTGYRGEEFGLCVFLVYGRKDGYVVALQWWLGIGVALGRLLDSKGGPWSCWWKKKLWFRRERETVIGENFRSYCYDPPHLVVSCLLFFFFWMEMNFRVSLCIY
jgi:hypothetical protein